MCIVFPVFSATPAAAQTQPGPFKHIIIVVQENRTPDNLFGANPSVANCRQENAFETGVDIVDGGYYYYYSQNQKITVPICNIPLPLSGWDQAVNGGNGDIVDPDHSYEGWGKDYDGAAGAGNTNDGFCTGEKYGRPDCPQYSYVQKSDVQPYFDIATAYGFANYMFQSNEGPSMEAHQFLFTGTSAPVMPGAEYATDFVADLTPDKQKAVPPTGCAYNGNAGWPHWVDPTGTVIQSPPLQNECYTHDSLVTDTGDCVEDGNGDSCDRTIPGWPHSADWAYYVEPGGTLLQGGGGTAGTSIWDAPAYIPEICYGQTTQWGTDNACGSGPFGMSTEWDDHVRIPNKGTYTNAPIFDDLYNCNLRAISWVIPDGSWSDHPQDNASSNVTVYGPSWVGDIVNAVGQACGQKYWTQEPTAIFITWDDWGGWFDHVPPYVARQEDHHTGYTECDPNTQWGCGYTDGLRVPLLVVSPYTPARYVSGACGGTQYPACGNAQNQPTQYVHDFGSILKYTEWNFGMPEIAAPRYADHNAPDNIPPYVPLSDFFPLWNGGTTPSPRGFTPITTQEPYTCFQHPGWANCMPSWAPSDPDSY